MVRMTWCVVLGWYFQRLLDGGPPIQAGFDSMTFLAEQVSHHPPGEGKPLTLCVFIFSLKFKN